MKFIIAAFTLIVASLVPDNALAWGPGVHLALGNSVLSNLGCLPPLVGALLGRHRSAFLYGCLSADIFIGKGSNFQPGHSHNWVTGFKLLSSAKDPRVLSYAYGYLTHLAADVVAHNYYVPNTLWTMPSGGKISHVYVEAQADSRFENERQSALALFRRPNQDTDTTLLSAMNKKRIPFLLKKQVVKGTLKVCALKEWGCSLRLADRLLPWNQSAGHLDEMFALSQNLVFDCLVDPKNAVAITFDPIGSQHLREVKQHRTKRKGNTSLFAPHKLITELAPPQTDLASPTHIAANS